MSQEHQALEQTQQALSLALNQQDWVAVAQLDSLCREQVDLAMDGSGRDDEALRSTLEQMLGVYRDLIGACQRHQQEVANELNQLKRAQQGAKVYQLFG
ncbi:flagellar protein FliT [Atopomonas sediminilitoris]|uniref:flagellar protein FliT n=1 Tax=Atopomonas sediminilitoris TaxID=2919919 RepID=UPI001F4D76C4|nr:flagellar protein FliT [Atopomonas sediminilitoris]MCJ8167956.1 flagellar protein FliT [Atopomonas sediminilitoris]